MKKVKTIVSTCLILCLCLSMMTLLCSAAESNADEINATTVYTCQANNTPFYRTKGGDSLGSLNAGDKMNVLSQDGVWYYGTAGTQTDLYAKIGNLKGYANSGAFNIY